jgi:MtN3 and saliva related transmembrane protein
VAIDIASGIGGGAALLSTISFLPQAIKIIRTRDTESISTGMYAVTVAGFMLWTAYGILLGKWPIIGSNSICLVVSAFILTMKLLPRHEKEKLADTLEGTAGQDAGGP